MTNSCILIHSSVCDTMNPVVQNTTQVMTWCGLCYRSARKRYCRLVWQTRTDCELPTD